MIVSTPLPADARRATLEARDGERVVARLSIRVPTPGLYLAGRFECEPGVEPRVAYDAFAAAVLPVAGPDGGEVLVVERPENDVWRAALEARGFAVVRRKAFVERSLLGALPDVPDGFTLRSLAEAGQAPFIARRQEASQGDPFEERRGRVRDLAGEWRELVAIPGDAFDPTRWFLVDDAQGPVGIVLPQANAKTGTFYYVGVVPPRRGQGLGGAIHALGLRLLADAGLERYVGSTDVRNAAMLAVFARNGCPVDGTEVYLALSAP